MKQIRKISILIFFFSLYTKSFLFSQNTVSQKELTASFENLISNSKKLQKQNLPDSAIQLLIKAKSVAKQLNDKAKIAQAHLALADRYYWGISDYYKCRKELDTLGNKYYDILTQNQKCKYLSQYGDAIYYDLEYVRSVEYYFKALEHVGTDSVMLARLYHNIGWVYTDLKKYDKGIEFGLKALEVAQKGHGDLTHKLEGLVYIYKTAKQYGKALEYQDKLALIDTSKEQTTFNYYQRLGIYVEMQKYDSALYYGAKALELAHEIKQTRTVMMILDDLLSACLKGDRMTNFKKYLTEYEELAIKYNKPYDVDMVYSLAGEYYLKRNNFAASKHYLDKAKQLQEQFKRENIEHTYFSLSQWYAINNDYKNAYHFLDKYSNISDSLHLLERYDATKALDDYLKIYSMENTLSKHRIELENQSLQLENEKSQKYMMLIGLVCILLLALFFLKNILDRKKMNKILVDKNKTIEIKNELLSTKNKEILDSISYAKRLQEAILPPQKLVLKHLENSFILYKPKDIVAGDFYWMETKNDLVLFAAADCTGHGVPGAMVSVVCSNALNRAVKEFEITEPGKILDKVRDLVVETFEKSENEVKDGMDISLCAFNLKSKKLYWSGANNPLWLVRGGELIDYAPDKQPIGKTENSKLFSTKEIDLKKGDSFYIFTDGYCDQFGGEKGKKFKTANFKKLILSLQKETMPGQREKINQVFIDWKGDLEQVDDVCVIGVRV